MILNLLARPGKSAFSIRSIPSVSRMAATSLAALIATITSSPLLAQTPTRPIGLGHYNLGMTISEAKAIPIRGVMQEYPYSLSCSDEPESSATINWAEKEEGVVTCEPASFDNQKARSSPVFVGTLFLSPTLKFHQGRLYEITVFPFSRDSTVFIDALKNKYGAPAKSSTSTVSNLYGAKWDKLTLEWTFGGQAIYLETPGTSRNDMLVIYSNVALASKIGAAVRSRRAKNVGI